MNRQQGAAAHRSTAREKLDAAEEAAAAFRRGVARVVERTDAGLYDVHEIRSVSRHMVSAMLTLQVYDPAVLEAIAAAVEQLVATRELERANGQREG